MGTFVCLCFMASVIVEVTLADIVFRIPEERDVGFYVGNVQAHVNRMGLQFTLMSHEGNRNFDSYFHLTERGGNLTVAKLIDREALCEFIDRCEFRLEIAAQSNDGFFDVVKCLVVIEDINDHGPTFPRHSVNVPVSEGVLPGATLTIEGARDRDTSDMYSLDSYVMIPYYRDEILPFTLSFSKNLDGSSIVKLEVSKPLDREVKDAYLLYIVAKDGGDPPLNGTLFVNITVTDMNDNYPRFNQPSYNVSVREDIPENTAILTISASDPDEGRNGIIQYRLSPNQLSDNLQLFAINDMTGELIVIGKLNYNSETSYKIIVEAIDQSVDMLTSQTFVTVTVVDIGNNAPEIHVNVLNAHKDYAKASEYANVGAVVAYVDITDHDTGRNGDVTCVARSNWFRLQRYDVNEYKVVVNNTLDRETEAVHNVTIHCEDKGSPPMGADASFNVTILDENDHDPRFTKQRYFSSIYENNEIGDTIITVSAFDLDSGDNARITYKMADNSTRFAFVNSKTGDVMANVIFNRESKFHQDLWLIVIAEDAGSPNRTGTTVVTIDVKDVNDHAPVFDQMPSRLWIRENLPADSIAGTVTADDADEGEFAVTKYALQPGSDVPFVVFSDGLIKTDRYLDREEKSEYKFMVTATDVADTSLYSTGYVTVFVLDENDNPPIITFPTSNNNTVRLPYLTSPATVISNVVATDRDQPGMPNSQLSYTMITLNSTSFFSINSETGDVILDAPIPTADYIGKVYVLSVIVRDQGESQKNATSVLRILISEQNGTATASGDNQNFLIAICVGAFTIVISVGIIVSICIIRHIDAIKRKQNVARTKVLSENMYSKNLGDVVDNMFPLPMDASFADKRKKEVSFSLADDDVIQNTSDDSGHGHDISNILLEPPPQYLQLDLPKKLDDAHSDVSGDSAGDSGKGGSDDDINMASLGRDDVTRWDHRRSRSPAMSQMHAITSRYPGSSSMPNQKIIPFSFKKSPAFPGTSANSAGTSYGGQLGGNSAPLHYDDHSNSSGFQSVDSHLNFNPAARNDGKLNFTGFSGHSPPDCVV